MILIPIGTDAPLYYRPFATAGLIVANILAFPLIFASRSDILLLRFGDGLRPWEWVTAAFMHFGPIHLIGNMVFLWTFGLIVEGKLGWWRFLLLYFGLCLLEGSVTQTMMLGYDGERNLAGGASGVISALIAIALIWTPKNEISLFYLFGFFMWWRMGVFEVTVTIFAVFFIGMDLIFAAIGGFSIGTELLHLIGAACGVPVGILLLKRGWVDCEGWDMFSLMKRESLRDQTIGPSVLSQKSLEERKQRLDSKLESVQKLSRQKLAASLQAAVRSGDAQAAWATYHKMRESDLHRGIDAASMMRLIDVLAKAQDWTSAVAALEDFIARFPDDAGRARLMLAQILVKRQQRPRAALRALEPLDLELMPPAEARLVVKVREEAETQIAEGVMEVAIPQ